MPVISSVNSRHTANVYRADSSTADKSNNKNINFVQKNIAKVSNTATGNPRLKTAQSRVDSHWNKPEQNRPVLTRQNAQIKLSTGEIYPEQSSAN